jgi:hypothetical protein
MRWPSSLKMSSTPRVFVNVYRIGYSLFDSQPSDIIGQGELKITPPMLLGTLAAVRKRIQQRGNARRSSVSRTTKATLIEPVPVT